MVDPSVHPRDWIDWFQALLTPLIVIAVVGVAFAQWWTARNRFRLDLFDRRWAVYIAVRDAIGEMFTHSDISREAQMRFLTGIRGAAWLFDQHIDKYLREEVWKRIAHLEGANAVYKAQGRVPEQEWQAAAAKRTEILKWVTDQYEEVDKMFGKFLVVDRHRLTGYGDVLLGSGNMQRPANFVARSRCSKCGAKWP
jgi:hypothetical protein